MVNALMSTQSFYVEELLLVFIVELYRNITRCSRVPNEYLQMRVCLLYDTPSNKKINVVNMLHLVFLVHF